MVMIKVLLPWWIFMFDVVLFISGSWFWGVSAIQGDFWDDWFVLSLFPVELQNMLLNQ